MAHQRRRFTSVGSVRRKRRRGAGRILDSGRLLRLRTEAAALLDDFGHTVRTRFPHPVAYRWRHIEAAVSGGATAQAYEAVLDAFEVPLCYAAQLALVMARTSDTDVAALTDIRRKLAGGRSGPGLGDWTAVLQETTGRAFRSLPADHPLGDLRHLLTGEAEEARRRLTRRRNDQAHLRRVEPADLPGALDAALHDLTTLLEQARFLSDLRLIHVTSARWDSLRGIATVGYRELMGDHPVVPTKTMDYRANDLEQGSLYVADDKRRLHLLRPFLIGRECPTCGNWSTFHVDSAPAGNVVLKSLEHGHTVEEPGLVLQSHLV